MTSESEKDISSNADVNEQPAIEQGVSPDASVEDDMANTEKPRKGIYLLPNLLTTGAMFGGFYAILASINGSYETAVLAIYVAGLFDMLDGRVARLTNTQSDFGVQYDSLSDMVSFGIAPAIVCFNWILHEVGKIGWAAAFIYASCAALRLARFNTQAATSDKRYFLGLASPAAAGVVVGLVWSFHTFQDNTGLALVASIITALSGLLMVSNFKYLSFKELDMRGKVPFMVILAVAMGFAIITIDPPRILLLMAIVYALSGPVLKFRKEKAAQ